LLFSLFQPSTVGAGSPAGPLRAADAAAIRVAGDVVPTWVLVRLEKPLSRRSSVDSFSLATGFTDLDARITQSGVHRIDHALKIAMREQRNPEALRRHGLDRTYRFHVPRGTDVRDFARMLSRVSGVEFAEPDPIIRPGVLIPNDPRFPDQWNFHQASDADIDAPEAWDVTVGNETLIAVVDTGVELLHPDLGGKWVPGYDFVDDDAIPQDQPGGQFSGHGTCVSSLAAANTDNSLGIAGTCWNCRVMPLRVWDEHGDFGFASMIADAFVWATDNGAQVINFSGGAPGGHTATLFRGVNYAYDAGVIIVTITHNHAQNDIRYPGEYLETITLGGTDGSDGLYVWSNYGPRTDVVGPAVDVWCAQMGSNYNFWSGTSLAAPQVSGLVGLMSSFDPSLGREETRHLVRAGAEDEVGSPADDLPGFDEKFGWGRINLHESLLAASSSVSLQVDGKQATRVYLETPNPRATSYDFIRGDVVALSEGWRGVNLGTVVCLENDSPDSDTAGNEDAAMPDPGEAFFYLSRFNAAPGAGSYGGSSRHRDRLVMPPKNAAWLVEGNEASAQFGRSVGSAGDVNNDGYGDVIVGAGLYNGDQQAEGRAYLYLGSSNGLDTVPAWTAEGNQTNARFGTLVAGAGDVNNDGYDDVIVGAPRYDNIQVDEGRAYVYLGTDSGLEQTPVWTADGGQDGAWFGYSVASAGDTNGDGRDDVIVGALYFTNGHEDEGGAWVYLGTDTGVAATPVWSTEGNQSFAWLGTAVAAVGDVNGDQYDDVIVGAPGYDNVQPNEGRLFVHHGSILGPRNFPSTTVEPDVADAWLGAWSLGNAGDVNCDGFDDVFATAGTYSNGEVQEGAVFVYPVTESGLQVSPMWTFEADLRFTKLGMAAAAGRLNDDACDDLIVGADFFDTDRTDDGRSWVFFGSSSGSSASPDWSDVGEGAGARHGAVASAGDVNGDGYDDVIIGEYLYDNAEANEGRAYVYLGSPTGPPPPASSGDCDSTGP
jgi:hypothetical protein